MKTNYLRWLAVLAGMGLIAIALSRGMGYWQESLIQMDSTLRISIGLILGLPFFVFVYWQQRKNKKSKTSLTLTGPLKPSRISSSVSLKAKLSA